MDDAELLRDAEHKRTMAGRRTITPRPIDWKEFTPREKRVVEIYIRTGRKAESFAEGSNFVNASEKTILRSSNRFWAQPKIAAIVESFQAEALRRANLRIDEAMDESAEEMFQDWKRREMMAIDATWVLRRAALLADFNIRAFIKTDKVGNAVYDFSDADDDDWYCIQEYTVEELQRGKGNNTYRVDKIKLKTFDKLRALELVGKHVEIQAFKENVSVDHTGEVAHRSMNDFYDDSKNESSSDSEPEAEPEPGS